MYDEYKSYDGSEQALPQAMTGEASARFVTRTYLNLFGATLFFAAFEALIFSIFGVGNIAQTLIVSPKLTGAGMLALCFAGPWLGNYMLQHSHSRLQQYLVLGYYAILYGVLFIPILTLAQAYCAYGIIFQACILTVALFAALSAAVFMTRANFSFLRTGLAFLGIAAFILIIASFVFGFELGIWFSIAMIALMCGYILYETSAMLYELEESDDIIASIMLFGSIMTLFFYILRLLMALDRR